MFGTSWKSLNFLSFGCASLSSNSLVMPSNHRCEPEVRAVLLAPLLVSNEKPAQKGKSKHTEIKVWCLMQHAVNHPDIWKYNRVMSSSLGECSMQHQGRKRRLRHKYLFVPQRYPLLLRGKKQLAGWKVCPTLKQWSSVGILPFLEFFLGFSKAPAAATEQRLNLCVCQLGHKRDVNTQPSALDRFMLMHYALRHRGRPKLFHPNTFIHLHQLNVIFKNINNL